MSSPQAAANFPFVDADLTKAWVDFRMPALGFEALLEAHRKNAAAFANASQVAFDGLKTLAQRQGDLFKTTVDDCSNVTNDVLGAASFEEKATKQADAARQIYLSNVARLRELSDIAVKANVTAADILNARVTQALDEFRALFAAPLAEPAAVVEDAVLVGDAVVPAEAEPATSAAPTIARKKKMAAPAAKAGRRPASRR